MPNQQILIVDDDPLLRELLSYKLAAAGFGVESANDGVAGLELARTLRPDLVVLDSMLPILTGPEFLRELKAQDCTFSIPVIMLTARKGQADIVEALRSGASDYLTKPFLPDELIARIAVVLARGSASEVRTDAA